MEELPDCFSETCSAYDSLSTQISRANQRAARFGNHKDVPLDNRGCRRPRQADPDSQNDVDHVVVTAGRRADGDRGRD